MIHLLNIYFLIQKIKITSTYFSHKHAKELKSLIATNIYRCLWLSGNITFWRNYKRVACGIEYGIRLTLHQIKESIRNRLKDIFENMFNVGYDILNTLEFLIFLKLIYKCLNKCNRNLFSYNTSLNKSRP